MDEFREAGNSLYREASRRRNAGEPHISILHQAMRTYSDGLVAYPDDVRLRLNRCAALIELGWFLTRLSRREAHPAN